MYYASIYVKRLLRGLVLAFTLYSYGLCMERDIPDCEVMDCEISLSNEMFQEDFLALFADCFFLPHDVMRSIAKTYLTLVLLAYEEATHYCVSTDSEESDFDTDTDIISKRDEEIVDLECLAKPYSSRDIKNKSYRSKDIENWKRLEPYVWYWVKMQKECNDSIEIVLQEALLLCNQHCSFVHGAVRLGNLPQAAAYLFLHLNDPLKMDVYDECIFGKTPLVAAVESGSLLVAQVLISLGASVHTSCGKRSPFFAALKYLNVGILKYLLFECGVDVNQRTKKRKNTALHFAIEIKNNDLLNLLLEWGADREIINAYGETPLFCATTLYYAPALAILLSKGADPNAQNRSKKVGLQVLFDNYKRIASERIDFKYLREPYMPENSIESCFNEDMNAIKKCITLLINDPRTDLKRDCFILCAQLNGLNAIASQIRASNLTSG